MRPVPDSSERELIAFDLAATPLEPGTTVLEASAGTGKTFTLTGLVLRLLLEERVEAVDQLLVVTFTRAATEELVGRVRQTLRGALAAFRTAAADQPVADPLLAALVAQHGPAGERIVRKALLDLDRLAVHTLHGFCRRVLEENAFESGLSFDPELVEDDRPLREEAARDVWRRLVSSGPSMVGAVAASRGLEPHSFLGDHARMRRHPSTRVVPVAPDLDLALDALAEARDALAAGLRPAHLRLTLGQVKWKSNAALRDEALRDARVRELAAFGESRGSKRGDDAALDAVAYFTREAIESSVYKKDRVQLEGIDTFDRASEVVAAAEAVHDALRAAFVDAFDDALAASKERQGALAFDDLLDRLDHALQDPRTGPRLRAAVRRRFQVALIDEFQDTDLVQYRIFRRLFGDATLWLVGDPKQAIYRFRGADVYAYLAARDGADRRYGLGRNWRSAAPMVAAVNAVFSGPLPFALDAVPFAPVEAAGSSGRQRLVGDDRPALDFRWLGSSKSKAQGEARALAAVADEVVRLLSSDLVLANEDAEDRDGLAAPRSLRPSDLAVLVRTNAQAEAVQAALRARRVPAIVGRAGDVFGSPAMAELETLLAAVVDPADAVAIRAASATITWGDGASDLARLGEDDTAWTERVEIFERARRAWRRTGFAAMARRLLDQRGVRARLLRLDDGERRLTDLLHAIELLHRAQHERGLSPEGLLAWLRAERRRDARRGDVAELRLESDARAVTVVTLHRAKGLEYEVVLCPFLWSARPADEPYEVPHDGGVLIDYGSDAVDSHRERAEIERLAEDLRLTYVALTRARRRTLVFWGAFGTQAGSRSSESALAYLLHGRVEDDVANGETSDEEADHDDATRFLRRSADRKDSWERDLADLAARFPGSIGVETVDLETLAAGPPRTWDGVDEPIPSLAARQAQVDVPARWRIESFSSLSRSATAPDSTPEVRAVGEGHGSVDGPDSIGRPRDQGGRSDRDGRSDSDGLTRELLAELPERSDPSVPSPLEPLDAPEPGSLTGSDDLFAFARGTRAGTCLHEVFEALDFQHFAADGPAVAPALKQSLRSTVREVLERHGLAARSDHLWPGRPAPPRDWDPVDVVLGAVVRVLQTPALGSTTGQPFPLGAVARDRRLVEWQFWAPLDGADPQRLADLFAHHGDATWSRYLPHLAQLAPARLEGFLTGFVDLIVEHEGRWWIVDWKSNDLGPRPADYAQAALARAMAHHHYVLQAHLYCLALHRFLARRLPGYEYSRHFGGYAYVFLRGAGAPKTSEVDTPPSPALRVGDAQLSLFGPPPSDSPRPGDDAASFEPAAPPLGWWIETPPAALIEALDQHWATAGDTTSGGSP